MRIGAKGLLQAGADIGERLFLVLLTIPFLWAFANALSTHPQVLLLAMSETLAVVLILIRRPGDMSMGPFPVAVALAGTALPLLARPGGTQLLPTAITSAIMMCGLSLNVASKLYLNRSFGLVAANRGVKVRGPYRFVRHPMYLGYITTEFGFLLVSFSISNLAIYAAAWSCQLMRIREEERLLRKDGAYQSFASRVPRRLIPGLY